MASKKEISEWMKIQKLKPMKGTAPMPPSPEPKLVLPEALPCAHCAKKPLTHPADSTGTVYVQCLTKGCITYGDIRWRIRLDIWNTRAGEHLTEQSRAELKRFSEIGEAFLRYMNLPLDAHPGVIGDALQHAARSSHEYNQRHRGYNQIDPNVKYAQWERAQTGRQSTGDDMADAMRYARQAPRRSGKNAQMEAEELRRGAEELQRRYDEMRKMLAKQNTSNPLPPGTQFKTDKRFIDGDWNP